MKHTPYKFFILLAFVLIIGFTIVTRFYGNDWDQGQHLNPDERFLTMVATEMKWPGSFEEYLNTNVSKLNPHNTKFDFYVYGTWPIILVKFVAEQLNLGDYGNLTLVGRAMSGLCDLLILILVFFITKRIIQSNIAGLFSMLIYALMVLPIQLSHFYTTDPYLTLFLTLTIYLLLFPPSIITGILVGLSAGFTLSAKISGILVFPSIAVSSVIYFFPELFSTIKHAYKKEKVLSKTLWKTIQTKSIQLALFYIFFAITLFLSFRLLMPYLFADSRILPFSLNPKVIQNWKTLKGFDDPNAYFPPGVQWIHQVKLLFPFLNIFWIGLGLPMGILSIIALLWSVKKIRKFSLVLILLSFSCVTFFYQGSQYAMPMRYFWSIYPMLAVFVGMFIYSICIKLKNDAKYVLLFCLLILLSIWPLSFMHMYTQPHTRVTASQWIYTHIPEGSRLSREHWDDPIPLNFPDHMGSIYEGEELPMYYPDTSEKWKEISDKIQRLDYIILSSNRVYGSITSAPEHYPQSTEFYRKLFTGELGFKKIAEFSSRPSLPFPMNICISIPFFRYGDIDRSVNHMDDKSTCTGIEFIDDYVDESWTVYDHPKVIIFQKL